MAQQLARLQLAPLQQAPVRRALWLRTASAAALGRPLHLLL
jgi:hypothetical protein